jgi:hypothetical protein
VRGGPPQVEGPEVINLAGRRHRQLRNPGVIFVEENGEGPGVRLAKKKRQK